MTHRGFDIADILLSGVTVNIPPFKGGRDKLNPEETDETARITAVRIHVERAIGRIKNHHILDGNCYLSMAPLMNQVFTVCSYLTKFLPPLVPLNEANTGSCLIPEQRKQSLMPESSCARKETVDIGILIIYKHGDRKIMQSFIITSRPSSRIRKWN